MPLFNPMKNRHITILMIALFAIFGARAQHVAMKTNLLYDATLSPSLGVEVRVAPRWTIDVSGNLNGWAVNNHRWKHWLVQPEARYWFCQAWSGHFLGVHALGGQYNVGHIDMPFSFLGSDFRKLKDNRYQGWFVGAGVAYGYTWILSRHWNFELELGFGWAYTRYDKFECHDCGKRIESDKPHNYVGPTKAAVNLVYIF